MSATLQTDRMGCRGRLGLLLERDRAWLLQKAKKLSPEEAEDLVQDTFVAFLSRFNHGPEVDSLWIRGWLLTVLRNRCVDRLRRPSATAVDPETFKEARIAGPCSIDAVELCGAERLRRERVEFAASGLSPKLRLVFDAMWCGASLEQVAAQLGISPGAVAKRWHDAKSKVRQRVRGRRH